MNTASEFGSHTWFRRAVIGVSHVMLLVSSRVVHAAPDARVCLAASHASIEALDGHDVTREYDELATCADDACPALVEEECQRRLDGLAKQVTVVRFTFANAGGAQTEPVYVAVDGKLEVVYAPRAPLAFRSGKHQLVFRTGTTRLTHEFDALGSGDVIERQLTWSPDVIVSAEPTLVSPTDEPRWNATKTTGVVLGGVGIVSLAVAAGFASSAIAKRDRAAVACPDVCRTSEDAERWAIAERAGDNATIWATVGWIGLAAGGTLLAVGFYTDATRKAPMVSVGLGPGTVALGGQF